MNREQLKMILWLRWRLMCNQWRRGAGVLGAFIAVGAGIGALGISAAGLIGGFCGGYFGLAGKPPQTVMVVWLVITVFFVFFWLIGLLTELQRSETIDLQKLTHLPVALGQMFAINYLVSHFSLSNIFVTPMMVGLALGMTLSFGPKMILLVPLIASTVLMITAWTYCFRGWLATLMTNPRRRRTVIMCVTMAIILMAQGPNLYFNVLNRHTAAPANTNSEHRQQDEQRGVEVNLAFGRLLAFQGFIPPLWLPLGAQNLAAGNSLPALLGTLGGFGIAALGLRRAYVNTVRFYQGDTGGKTAKPIVSTGEKKSATTRAKNGRNFLERFIPFVPEQSAVVALATLRSQFRAPEVKMTWGTSFIVTIIVGASIFFHAAPNLPEVAKPFIATGSAMFPIFFLVQFFGNQFGFDRDGFRSLILSPAERRLILLGKNLAGLPVEAVFGGMLILLAALRLHLSAVIILATLFQIASLMMMAGLAGNLLSILVPYRIQPGTMRPTKLPGLAMIVLMFFQMIFPVAMLPVFFGPLLELFWHRLQWPDFMPVNLICSALFCGFVALVYWQTLAPLGRLLQRRETKILAAITIETE
jgi:hypothetical protein